MPIHSITGYAALAAILGTLACGGQARTEDTPQPEEAAAARDTAADTLAAARDTAIDTLATEGDTTAQNPPGYRGMERDTTLVPPAEQQPGDTFLQQQGQGQPQDTAGYGGLERADTTGRDTTGAAGVTDTAGAVQTDTTQMQGGVDTTGMSDTTGYNPSQEQTQDTTAR
jgi:hypothetical protein